MTARLVLPGTESVIMSVSHSILILNNFIMRGAIGLFINESFVGVSKRNMDDYWILVLILLVTSFIPLTYITKIVPSDE